MDRPTSIYLYHMDSGHTRDFPLKIRLFCLTSVDLRSVDIRKRLLATFLWRKFDHILLFTSASTLLLLSTLEDDS